MEKVDVVIAWVDGSDPLWLKERSEAFPQFEISNSQYRDWGLLKYWFRGIEENADWIDKIYFVTWGHVPNFLDLTHPKIEIVKHEDYIPKQYLPTFSSNPIEMNFHRIKGLGEKFVYFNDDMYLINKTSLEDFFKDGKPCDVAILNPIAPADYDSIAGTMLNNISIINKHFSVRESIRRSPFKWFNYKYRSLNLLNLIFLPWRNAVGLYQQHLPSSLLKSVYEEVWEKEKEILDDTSRSSIRDVKRDINQWLIKEWQVMQGKFSPRSIKFGKYLMVRNNDDIDKARKIILNSRVKSVCINDHVEDNVEEVMNCLLEIFEKKFPNKSTFER